MTLLIDKYTITGTPAEISEFIHLHQVNTSISTISDIPEITIPYSQVIDWNDSSAITTDTSVNKTYTYTYEPK